MHCAGDVFGAQLNHSSYIDKSFGLSIGVYGKITKSARLKVSAMASGCAKNMKNAVGECLWTRAFVALAVPLCIQKLAP